MLTSFFFSKIVHTRSSFNYVNIEDNKTLRFGKPNTTFAIMNIIDLLSFRYDDLGFVCGVWYTSSEKMADIDLE